MANKVVFEVQVTDKGSLQIVTKEVDALGKSVEATGAKHKTASKQAGDFYNTQDKGIIGTANSTKSFSKLAETIGSSSGVVGAYATLAANVFAVTAAFDALSKAAQVEQITAGLEAMGNRMGVTLSISAAKLKEITGNAISLQQAYKSTAQIASAGLGTKAIADLGQVAKDTSFALGRDVTDSVDRLSRGVVKLEPELLDELGLMTKINESTAKYAATLGKSETQLTNFEKRQGFLNAIVAEGTAKFGGLADKAGDTKNLDILASTLTDLKNDILGFINSGALPLAGIFSNKGFLLAGMILFASTISRQLLPGLANLSVQAAKTTAALLEQAQATASNITALDKAPRGYKSIQTAMLEGTATAAQYEKGLGLLNKRMTTINKQQLTLQPGTTKFQNNVGDLAQLDAHLETLKEVQAIEAQASISSKTSKAIQAAGNRELTLSYQLLTSAVKEYYGTLTMAEPKVGLLGKTTNILKAGLISAFTGLVSFGSTLKDLRWSSVTNGAKSAITAIAAFRDRLDAADKTISTMSGSTAWAGISSGATKAFNIIKAGALGAKIAVLSLASAFLDFIPVIGQLVLVGSILYEGYKWLKDFFTSEATKKYNKDLEDQKNILDAIQGKIDEINRLRSAAINPGIAEAAAQKVITGQIREQIDQYKILAADQAKTFSKGQTNSGLAINETPQYKLLESLKKLSPEIAKEVDKAVDAQGLSKRIKNTFQNTSIEDINKLNTAILNLGKGGVATLGDEFDDLTESYKQTDLAIAEFNKNAVPSTPYDTIVKGLDGVTQSLTKIAIASTSSADYIDKMSAAVEIAGPKLTRFLTPDTQKAIKDYSDLYEKIKSIQALGQKASPQDVANLDILKQRVAMASSEIYLAQEKLTIAQADQRQTAATVQLAQARLDKLSSFTALSGKDIIRRREAENGILQLQAAQLESQKAIVETQIIALKATRDQVELELQKLEVYKQIKNELKDTTTLTTASSITDAEKRKSDLLAEQASNKPGGRSKALIAADIADVNKVLVDLQKLSAVNNELRDSTAQIKALSTQQAAILAKQTSKAVMNAEANAVNVQTRADNENMIRKNLQDQVILTQTIAANQEKAAKGVVSQANEYTRIVDAIQEQVATDKKAAQGETATLIAGQLSEATKAREQGSETAGILAARIVAEKEALRIKLAQIDATAISNTLDKVGLDLVTKYPQMQRDNLQYQEKLNAAITETVSLDREHSELIREINRKREGVVAGDDYGKVTAIEEAKDALKIAIDEATLKKDIIKLEYALLNAQRQQLEDELKAKQAALVKLNSPVVDPQIAAYQNLIDGLEKGSGTIIAATNAAVSNVDKGVDNARLKLTSALIDRPETDTALGRIAQRKEKRGVINGTADPSLGKNTTALEANTKAVSTKTAANDNKPMSFGDAAKGFGDITTVGDNSLLSTFQNMADQLGPQGQIIPQIITGINSITTATTNMMEVFNKAGSTTTDKFVAVGAVVSSMVGTIGSILNSASQQRIANIDAEITAEQNRDGKSAESVAKIAALQKQKDSVAKKAFDTNKKIMMAQAIIATATGVAQALTLGPILGPIMAVAIGALGAAELAIIASTSYQSSSASAASVGPSTLTIGAANSNPTVDLAKQNNNVGGEQGFVRGQSGYGTNSSDYQLVGSAYGGSQSRGYGNSAYLVGEKGPEIMTPDTPMMVKPVNDNEANNKPISAEINIHALDSGGVADVLHSQRGNIISMLREAANSSGEKFMESVNVNVYTRPNVSRL